jgi:hypothetical protein
VVEGEQAAVERLEGLGLTGAVLSGRPPAFAVGDGEERLDLSLAGKRGLVRLAPPPGPVRRRFRWFAPDGGDPRAAEGEAKVAARKTT